MSTLAELSEEHERARRCLDAVAMTNVSGKTPEEQIALSRQYDEARLACVTARARLEAFIEQESRHATPPQQDVRAAVIEECARELELRGPDLVFYDRPGSPQGNRLPNKYDFAKTIRALASQPAPASALVRAAVSEGRVAKLEAALMALRPWVISVRALATIDDALYGELALTDAQGESHGG